MKKVSDILPNRSQTMINFSQLRSVSRDWKYKIDLVPIYEKYSAGLSPADTPIAGKEIANVLKQNETNLPAGCPIEPFLRAKTEQQLTAAMNRLYDWADANSVWVATF